VGLHPDDPGSLVRSEPITVVLAADTGFCKQLAVTITSIAATASERRHRIVVLHDGYEPGLIARVEAAASNQIEICWLDARSTDYDDVHLPDWLGAPALFRLRIGELLPPDVARTIYLDTDIVVRQPLDDLWASDLGAGVVGAVRDALLPWAASPFGLPWSRLGVPPQSSYFNSGVLLIDMVRWRSEEIGRRSLALLKEHRFYTGDQCALNAVLTGNWVRIAPRWNLQTGHLTGEGCLAWVTEPAEDLREALEDPAIVHFNHSLWNRPWEVGSAHPRRDEWFARLDQTPWGGWRPIGPSPTRRAARRLQRAARTLLTGSY